MSVGELMRRSQTAATIENSARMISTMRYVHVNLSHGQSKKPFHPVIEETPQSLAPIHGRGASWSPANRFEKLHVDLNDVDAPLATSVGCCRSTESLTRGDASRDARRNIFVTARKRSLRAINSPDVGFEDERESVSRLRAWLHLLFRAADARVSRIFCRPGFRSKIMVKTDAPQLLREELELSPRMETASPGDERGDRSLINRSRRKLRITRGCLEVLAKFRNPVAIHHEEPSRHARYRSFA